MDKQTDIGLTSRGVAREPVTFRLEISLLQRLRAIAKKQKLTMTSIVEVAVREYLEH